MGAYKREAVVVIQLGAYIHRVLTFYGCLLSRFYGMRLDDRNWIAIATLNWVNLEYAA